MCRSPATEQNSPLCESELRGQFDRRPTLGLAHICLPSSPASPHTAETSCPEFLGSDAGVRLCHVLAGLKRGHRAAFLSARRSLHFKMVGMCV